MDYRAVDPADCGALRRAVYSVLQLLNMLALYVPLAIGGVDMLLAAMPAARLRGLAAGPVDFTSWTFYRDALVASFVLFFGAVLVGLLFVVTVPRVLNLAIKPDKVYPLVRLPLLGPPDDRAPDQSEVLHASLR